MLCHLKYTNDSIKEVKDMGISKRTVFMAIVILSLFLFFSFNVYAEPLGKFSLQQKQRPKQQVLISQNGRFVFGQISDSSKDKFMLDTFTGRLWQISETGAIGLFLKSVSYRTEKGKLSPLPDGVSGTVSKKAKKK